MKLNVDGVEGFRKAEEARALVRRRLLRWLAIACGLGLLALAVAKLPGMMLRHAHHQRIACVNRIYETGRGDPEQCRATARRWLWLPGLAPWLSAKVRQERVNADYDAATDALTLATAVHPNARLRDAAAARVLAASTHGPTEIFTAPAFELIEAGALEVLVAGGRGDPRRDAPLEAALTLGDSTAARELATLPGADESDFNLAKTRGLVLCLAGDPAGGQKLLAAAARGYEAAIHGVWSEGRLAAFACGAHEDEPPYDKEVIHALEWVDPADAPSAAEMLQTSSYRYGTDRARLPLVAQAITPDTDLEAALRLVVLEGRPAVQARLEAFASAWTLERPRTDIGSSPIVLPPARLEVAADRLHALAATAPERLELKDDREVTGGRAHQNRVEDVPGLLRHAEWALRLDAAAEWARRGDRVRARAALELLEPLKSDPDSAFLASLIRAAIGDDARALELASAAAAGFAESSSKGRVLVEERLAFALARVGRFDEAYAAAVRAQTAGFALGEARKGEDAYLDPLALLQGDATWLVAALALRTGKGVAGVPHLPPAPDKLGELAPELEQVAWFMALTQRPENQRGVSRWHAGNEISAPKLVLPAALYVIGRACDGDCEVETWLDRAAGSSGLRTLPLAQLMLARAEAARWRGDDAAITRWTARRAKLLATVHDDKSALLSAQLGF